MESQIQESNRLQDDKNIRYVAIAFAVILLLAPIFTRGIFGWAMATVVMTEIAIVAFFMMIFVMLIGSKMDHYPTQSDDSPSVQAWTKRLAAVEAARTAQADQQSTALADLPEDATPNQVAAAVNQATDTGKTVSDLSDEERAAKREAAIARRAARAAKNAQEES